MSDEKNLITYKEETYGTPPELKFGGANTGMTYVQRQTRYSRIGNRVFFDLHMYLSALGSSTGDATITGLPLTAANNGPWMQYAQCSIRLSSMTSMSGHLMVSVEPNTTTLSLAQLNTGTQSNLTHANFSGNEEIYISGSYECAN